ncbi:hypothetical protein AOQ84DRAFT_317365 [Glonium stellatum]|uniref:DNA 3'-5' helicase n=1 Tax=Glonium stellatum TaxID=574774 RepID=A0A8E2F3D4_9PEZI|nr:hypothetical protein AOQ84DRAFT_317365 [Glonium stellatum]
MTIDASRRGGSWGGLPMKHISLITLTFQNSALILIMHYSRIMPLTSTHRYFTSTAVFLNEVIKLSISLTMALYDMSSNLPPNTPATTLFSNLSEAVFTGDSWKLAIPAMLYTLQNTLQYVAVSNLDAATFQVTYQLKILTTAFFSVILLGRSLSTRKWVSLVLLMIGVAVVQIPRGSDPASLQSLKDTQARIFWPRSLEELRDLGSTAAAQLTKRSATYEGIEEDVAMQNPQLNASLGLISVIIACILSGLAGVTFEKILKDSNATASLWIRNVQLSFYSIFPALFLGVIFKDGEDIAKTGFFVGYNWVVWTAITSQALGGVIVAMVVNYADNIAKNFATSISIIISFLASVWFFQFSITANYVIGTSIVLFSTYLYSSQDRLRPPPIRIADYEKTTIDGNPSYFDLERTAAPLAKSPLRAEALTTSRPGTPTIERHHFRGNSERKQFVKRDEHMSPEHQLFRSVQGTRSNELHLPEIRRTTVMGHDIPELDIVLDRELPLDSFDKELLRRPYQDRQRQAEQGQARLSLAPNTTRYMDRGDSRSRQELLEMEQGLIEVSQHHFINSNMPLARFSYNTPAVLDSSSSPRGLPSSPSLKACERLGKYPRAASQRPPKRFLDDESIQCLKDSASQNFESSYVNADPKRIKLQHAPAMVGGIELIPVNKLPDRLRTVFPFPLFNAIQSKCFQQVYESGDNFVLSSPTGSGKTAVLELAICRLINGYPSGQYKIVYQAPTKSLCSERYRDWQKRFGPLHLECAELTGDSDNSQLRNVQNASIIITTPEKWDSMTRKWKDHEKLMRLVKLFLIDEVHILKDDRGATLEAVVSRMKSVGSDVRFVALSATVPNFEDIATWLGKDSTHHDEPAARKKFGEEFRPVKLQKHVCGYKSHANDFVFDKFLDSKLPEVIAKYSKRKPIMVFCFTRNSTVSTAKFLANWWSTNSPKDRYWEAPKHALTFMDNEIRNCASAGVAFHHAGLDPNDRIAVETGYLKGDINVICCTSTLAVGVNLPCHFVIIKNTVFYAGSCLKEYSDLEVIQMLGRAGRPQFDDSAEAAIMTRRQKVEDYEKMVTGQQLLESCLHTNLIDHLNAEIGLGTITDLNTAKKWLAGTFLFVRLKQNPGYYKLEGARRNQNVDEQLDVICGRDIKFLQEADLVTKGQTLRSTEYGDAMTRYYVQFETMKAFLGLPPKAKISEILSALAQAAEFREVRFRAGEKPVYKELNRSPSIRFPIPVDLALPAHKVSLVVQSILGGADVPWDEKTIKHRQQYTVEIGIIFRHINRLIRCVIDCQLFLEDSVAIRNALMLERSLGARAWDDSPLQLKQIEQLGIVTVRKLVNAGINTIELLENTEPHRIEMILNKNPPFGMRLLDRLKSFPKLRVSANVFNKSVTKCGDGVMLKVKADIGFMNERPAIQHRGKPVYICLLAETSDGHKIHFARISGQKLGNGQDLVFPVLLKSPDLSITCYVMCDEIAGTMRQATVRPEIPSSMFPVKPQKQPLASVSKRHIPNTSRRRVEGVGDRLNSPETCDEFGDDDIDDIDLVQAAGRDLDFEHIENYGDATMALTRQNTVNNTFSQKRKHAEPTVEEEDNGPRQLSNGKWACNHKCKDKNACKHMCCRDGLDKPPKRPVKKSGSSMNASIEQGLTKPSRSEAHDKTQKNLQLSSSRSKSSANVEHLDLTEEDNYAAHASQDYRTLHRLHVSVQGNAPPSSVSAVMHKKPAYTYAKGDEPKLSFLTTTHDNEQKPDSSSDYGNDWIDDLPSPSNVPALAQRTSENGASSSMVHSFKALEEIAEDMEIGNYYDSNLDDDDSMLDAAMVGLVDSQYLQQENNDDDLQSLEGAFGVEVEDEHDKFVSENKESMSPVESSLPPQEPAAPSKIALQAISPEEGGSLFFNNTSSPRGPDDGPALNRSFAQRKAPAGIEQTPDIAVTQSDKRPAFEGIHSEDMIVRENVPSQPASQSLSSIAIPPGYEDIEPWLIAEFGDIIEFT